MIFDLPTIIVSRPQNRLKRGRLIYSAAVLTALSRDALLYVLSVSYLNIFAHNGAFHLTLLLQFGIRRVRIPLRN